MNRRGEEERRGVARPYRSPDAALWVEAYLACQAIIMGITGGFLNTGALATSLRMMNEFWLWGWLFTVTGTGLLVTCILELRCRSRQADTHCIRRFAVAREMFNLFAVPAWGFGIFTLKLSEYRPVLVPSLCALAFGVSLVIFWINVRAQFPQSERRSAAAAHVGHVVGG